MSTPAIVINLDRSTDRLAHMQAEFARVGMSFERFQAVNGADLPDSVKPYFCDASGNVVSPLRPGEIGCYASHLAVWQRIAAGDYGPAALVCEDDITLADDIAAVLNDAIAALPGGWGVVRLVNRWDHRRAFRLASVGSGRHLVRYWRMPMLSGAYLLSPQGAARLLKPEIRTRGVDADLCRPWAWGIDHYGVSPAPARQDDVSPSVIDAAGMRVHAKRRDWVPRLFRPAEIARCLYVARGLLRV